MKLYFLRHGLADHPDWLGSDFERPLTEKGKARMAREAEAMAALGLTLDLILTSPLARARQTAEIVATGMELSDRLAEDERLAPGFGADELAQILESHAGAGDLMLVGHEPDFSETISALIGGGTVVCKKGGLARVDLQDGSGLEGELVWLIPPSVLALFGRGIVG